MNENGAPPRPTLDDIHAAHERIRSRLHRTPVLSCAAIDAACDAQVFFKCENFQKVGAFKARGATNAVFSLSDDAASRGVATHSSGNHAQALALAARERGIPAYVVMPRGAPAVKRRAVVGYGAEITECEPTLQAREDGLAAVVEGTGATFIHPYNDLRIIAGQATAAVELLEDEPGLDAVLAPVGGGGLLSGTALAVSHLAPNCRVIGAEPVMADDAARSFAAGRIIPQTDPRTIADGLRTSLGELTFPIIRDLVLAIVTVSEKEIVAAMRLVWERMKIIIEPSSAVPVAVLMARRGEVPGRRVGVVVSGGNVELGKLPW